MTSGITWGEGVFSPETNIKKIESYIPTFLTHPRIDNAVNEDETITNGWGYPFTDDGLDHSDDPDYVAPTPLGTFEGSKQIKLLSKKDDRWGKAITPGNFVYGNIDWRGPELDTLDDGTKVYINLSWNGPQQRYFPDERYDFSDATAHEVYFRGNYVAVTPHPVLGAGAKKNDKENEDDADSWTLYVICRNDLADVIYYYNLNLMGWNEETLTEVVRDQLRSAYNLQTNPNGYRILATIPKQSTDGGSESSEALIARTPWFFNESCTKAVCMRETEFTYLDKNSTSYTETGVSKYSITIASGDLVNAGNLRKPYWIERHKYFRYPPDPNTTSSPEDYMWCFGPCINVGWDDTDEEDAECLVEENPDVYEDNNHHYVRFRLEQYLYYKGDQIVATDFDGDTQITARISMEAIRTHNQEFNWGVDCDTYYGSPLADVANPCSNEIVDCATDDCSNNEKPACNQYPDIPPEYLNGAVSPWTGGTAQYILKFKNSTGDHEFTIFSDFFGTEYEKLNNGQKRDEFDVVLEYHGYVKRFPHYLDLRHPFAVSYTELYLDEWIQWRKDTTYGRFTKPSGTVNTLLYQNEAYSINTDEPEYITEQTLYDTPGVGHILGYDWKGNQLTSRTDFGGPDWFFSDEDLTFDNTNDDGDYEFITDAVGDTWYEGLDARSTDQSDVEPAYTDWYAGSLKPHKWQSWTTFFNNTHFDDILNADVHLNLVNGGFGSTKQDWLFSYMQPMPATEDHTEESGIYHNYLTKEDALTVMGDPAKLLYPVGVY